MLISISNQGYFSELLLELAYPPLYFALMFFDGVEIEMHILTL